MKTIKNTLATGTFLLLLGVKSAFSQVSSVYSECILAKHNDSNGRNGSFVKSNIEYSLPFKFSGYSWVEFHNGSFVSRTTFSNIFYKIFGIKSQVRLLDEIIPQIGAGPRINLPDISKNVNFHVAYLPLWVSPSEGLVENFSEFQYGFSAKLPFDIYLAGFGNINTNGKRNSDGELIGRQFTYGETNISKGFGKKLKNQRRRFELGINLGFLKHNNGNFLPKTHLRANFRINTN